MREIESGLLLRLFARARRSGNGWWRATCPFCPIRVGKDDKRQSLGIFAGSAVYHCFRCGTKGKLDRDQVPSAILDDAPPEDVGPVNHAPPEGYVPLWEEPGLSALSLEEARAYLHGRGVHEDVWRAARIGACTKGRHFGRVVLPIIAPSTGEWLGYVARAWAPSSLPYLNTPGMRRVLYNHEALHVETDAPAIIVEGIFDAISVWPDGVAVLGKPSHEQIDAFRTARRPIAIVLDGDAWEEGWALAQLLRFDGVRAGSVRLPPKLDPDEIPSAELRAMAAAACIHET